MISTLKNLRFLPQVLLGFSGSPYAEDHVKFKTGKDCFIYIAVNAHWEPHTLNLPIIPDGFFWHLVFDSNGFSSECGNEKRLDGFASVSVEARTVKVLLAK